MLLDKGLVPRRYQATSRSAKLRPGSPTLTAESRLTEDQIDASEPCRLMGQPSCRPGVSKIRAGSDRRSATRVGFFSICIPLSGGSRSSISTAKGLAAALADRAPVLLHHQRVEALAVKEQGRVILDPFRSSRMSPTSERISGILRSRAAMRQRGDEATVRFGVIDGR